MNLFFRLEFFYFLTITVVSLIGGQLQHSLVKEVRQHVVSRAISGTFLYGIVPMLRILGGFSRCEWLAKTAIRYCDWSNLELFSTVIGWLNFEYIFVIG